MASQKKKIALFADVLEENFDGVSVTLHKILKNAPQDRFEFLVITSHPPKNPESIPHKIVVCKYMKLPFQKGYRLGLPGKEAEVALDEFNPDLIHFTSPSPFGKFAIKYGRKNDIPVINIYHTHFPAYIKYHIGVVGKFLFGWLINALLMRFYKDSDLTLAPTSPIKSDLAKLGVPNHKMKVWGRAIETGSFNPKYRDENYFDGSIPKGHKKVLFVSRLIKEKDMTTFYRVHRKLTQLDDKVTFVVTGDGPMRELLEKKMTRNAIFTGKRTGEELAKIYASCDVFMFPSSSETFGNVVIEAMASGLPAVCANAGGPAELVKDNLNGYLVESGDVKGFVRKIKQILDDDTLRREMSEAARKSVETRTLDDLHENLWNTYESVIAGNQTVQEVSGMVEMEPAAIPA